MNFVKVSRRRKHCEISVDPDQEVEPPMYATKRILRLPIPQQDGLMVGFFSEVKMVEESKSKALEM